MKNKIEINAGFFKSLATTQLTPLEYKCVLLLCEGKEQTKAQISKILEVSPQHTGKAMIQLENLGIIYKTRTEGRNTFFTYNDKYTTETQLPGQTKL